MYRRCVHCAVVPLHCVVHTPSPCRRLREGEGVGGGVTCDVCGWWQYATLAGTAWTQWGRVGEGLKGRGDLCM